VAEIKRIDPGCEQLQAALAVGTSFGVTGTVLLSPWRS